MVSISKNVLIATAAGLLMIFLIPGVLAGHAMASHLTPQKRYNDGYNNGYSAAQSDSVYNPSCDPNSQYTSDGQHTAYYCNGWSDGYQAGWGSSSHGDTTNTGTQQEQNSAVNVHGNNNDIRVNQGQSSDSGNSFDDGHHHSDSSGNLPNCHVICIG